ncbi:MAG: carbon monoxide dehydrogenase, partial [Gammaproteobacteria bacterium]|nr:carbon monoxide dehydrogenase [Gammaproteobacteria bacterium]
MIIEEKQEIAASPKKVWEGLNDPDTLRACLPGCEEFELIEPNKFLVVMQAKIGPVKARFKGEIDLADINPPHSYTITGSGKGGVAGFAKGVARVSLGGLNNGDATEMNYRIEVTVGGKLA